MSTGPSSRPRSLGSDQSEPPGEVSPSGDDGFFGGPFRDFEHIGGIHLTGTVLWCDAARKNGLNFLSSALAGEIGKNRRVLCTEETYRIATRGKGKLEALTAPYDQPLTVGDLSLSLHPSGHMLGAAQIRVEREGRVVVYAGEVSTRASLTALTAEPIPCDVLALPATFGARAFQFPERQPVLADIEAFIKETLSARQTPVLLAQPMGIGQELLVSLGRSGHRLRVHRSIAEVAKLYESLGVTMAAYKRLTSRIGKGEVALMPPILRRKVDELVPDARIALVGPRAVDAPHVHQMAVSEAFPLSNIADHSDLLAFVEATGARQVFLKSGHVEAFGSDLRERGIRVHDLLPREQLELF